ncbi:hypothetical protein EV359DRAFT_62998 [Lentinula novae-zelandiae]|nr:hypothetical protein EV359DRAFT_62998 [Lentinula novae-zelandiae]
MPTSMFNQRLPGVYIANPATTTHILVNWIQRKFVADTLNEGRLSENIYGHANDGSRFIWETQTLVLVCQLLHKVLSIIIHLVVRKNSRALNLNKRLRQIEYMNVSTHANLRRRFASKTIHFKQEREPMIINTSPSIQIHWHSQTRANNFVIHFSQIGPLKAESKVFMMWMRLKIASRNFNDRIDKPSSRSNVLDSICNELLAPAFYSAGLERSGVNWTIKNSKTGTSATYLRASNCCYAAKFLRIQSPATSMKDSQHRSQYATPHGTSHYANQMT